MKRKGRNKTEIIHRKHDCVTKIPREATKSKRINK